MNVKRNLKRAGFSIVELLTVMAVIAILIGLLAPALTLVRDFAKEIQQRAQFHAIETGLEIFKTNFGKYPESIDNQNKTGAVDATPYSGANKLAEAMVGLDFLGFHPNSDLRAIGTFSHDDGTGTTVEADVYHPGSSYAGGGNLLFAETDIENMDARKGPLIELENAGAFQMADVYGNGDHGAYLADSLVLCDVYSKTRTSTKKTGAPVLYYKANSIYKIQDSTAADSIYDLDDNSGLVALGSVDDGTTHPLATAEQFNKMIVNPDISSVARPYKADTYILVSAGKDALYGTSDDIFNFNKDLN
jgi:prepilin-type N-terminal cleavage/methylation domain-containing protein